VIGRFLPVLLKGFIIILLIAIFVSGWFVIRAMIYKPTVPRTAAERAIMDGEEAVKADPSSVEARLGLAAAYIGVARYEDAIKQLNVAKRLDPKNVRAYYMLGVAYKDQNRLDEAILNLKKAGELQGETADVYGNVFYELGMAYKQKKDYYNAIEAFDRTLSYGVNLYALKELAEAFERVGSRKEAEITYLNILQRDVENRDALAALKRLGTDKKIIEEVQRSGMHKQ